jgi:hypothetical protein
MITCLDATSGRHPFTIFIDARHFTVMFKQYTIYVMKVEMVNMITDKEAKEARGKLKSQFSAFLLYERQTRSFAAEIT